MNRPSRPIRVFILVAAVACLGLTMCHFSKKPETPPPANATASGSEPQVDPPAGSGSAPAAPKQAPNQAAKPQKPQPYFPATKSAGPLR